MNNNNVRLASITHLIMISLNIDQTLLTDSASIGCWLSDGVTVPMFNIYYLTVKLNIPSFPFFFYDFNI